MSKFTLKIREVFWKLGIDFRKYHPANIPHSLLQLLYVQLGVNTVLDIGANIGQFALTTRIYGFQGNIISFEPLNSAYIQLLENSLKDKKWLIHERCALGSEDGISIINVSANSVSSSLLPMHSNHLNAAPSSVYISQEEILVRTLDHCLSSYDIDLRNTFLKIDAQGFESQVINGAKNSLSHIPGVLCELSLVELYDGQKDWQHIINSFLSLGYSVWSIIPGFADKQSGRLLQVDVVFVRSELINNLPS